MSPEVMVIAVSILVAFVILVWIIMNFYQKCPPNQAMIISGLGCAYDGRQFKIVVGGGAVMLPMIQQRSLLSLEVHKSDLALASVYAKNSVPVSVRASVQYKIKGDNTSIAAAAESLLGKPEEEMTHIVEDRIEKRVIDRVAQSDLNELQSNCSQLSDEIVRDVQPDLDALGIAIISFSIKSIDPVYQASV